MHMLKGKQYKIAQVAEPRDKITKADFDQLNKGKKKKKKQSKIAKTMMA